MKKVKYFIAYISDIENIPTGVLQVVFTFLTLGTWGLGVLLSDKIPHLRPDFVGLLFVSLGCWLFGLPGIVFIQRREAPVGFGIIFNGRKAILYGILYALLPWGFAIYCIIRAIRVISGSNP